MAATVLTLRAPPPHRVDLAALLPSVLAGQDAAAITRIPLGRLCVGDLFAVRAGDEATLVIEGGSALFDGVGAGMAAGSLRIVGAVGDGAGAGMTGGAVEIMGDAGDHPGGVPAAGRTGMAGGRVVVRGSAGARAGDRMRRGLLVIEGAAGDYPASRMIAGTLVVCGPVGAAPGTLMRRGTLLLGAAPPPPPRFAASGLAPDGVFLTLLARALHPHSALAARLAAAVRQRLLGDLAGPGQGEILLAGAVSDATGQT